VGCQVGQDWARDLREPGLFERYRKDAIVLTAEPGDILYWPYTWWHMALSDTPEVPTFVFHIVLYNRPRAAVLSDVLSGLLKQLPGASERIDTWGAFPSTATGPVPPPAEVSGSFDMLRAALQPEIVQPLLMDPWMRHVTGYGFDHLPPGRCARTRSIRSRGTSRTNRCTSGATVTESPCPTPRT
jgi:50S ribosomal protein L16 3-hydroxylase